ncbi:MAG: hypothetical protein HMLKMBBP_02595 [Planctomycetes bacterium]|nr:hypothetical protein [Planctomycetota bacterium]
MLWAEGLAAAFAGDAAGAAARFREGRDASRPAGEHPALFLRLPAVSPDGK